MAKGSVRFFETLFDERVDPTMSLAAHLSLVDEV